MPDAPPLTEALELFYSYSHKDEDLRDELETHLSLLRRQKVIRAWHDRGILAGEEWGGKIDEHLKTADIILLLISADFLASDYCYDIELGLAMERHERGEARVIPVILRPCDWSGAPFGKLQAVPKNARPVTTWKNHDEAFTDIAKGIRRAAESLLAQRKPPDPTPAPSMAAPSQIPRPPVVGFVARRDEQGRDIVGRLEEELAPEKNQLAALWGPGGSGKTTLAAEFVRDTEGLFGGRVAWVSALGRAEFGHATLLDEIATRLGREDLRKLAPEAKAAQVAALVSGAPTLVVLDNFETVSAEEQARCLDFLAQAACPALVTTRSFINRDDVYNIPLAAMSLDEARDFLGRLVERTRKPSNFDRLDRDDLIRRCEANPLVLQWVVRQIDLAKRPQDVLDDLARGEGDAAERVFTRSFNLPQLGDDGRAALLALSLFTPDASRPALAQVAGFGEDLRRLNKAVESLSALWLVETTEGNERLFLRGLTRGLAKSRLSADPQVNTTYERFAQYFLGYAVAHKRTSLENLVALEAERDNLFSALDVCAVTNDWYGLVMTRNVLGNYLNIRGYWDESIKYGEQAEVAAREGGADGYVPRFITSVANIRLLRGEHEEARRSYERALAIAIEIGDEGEGASILNSLGLALQRQGEAQQARECFSQSLELFNKLGEESGAANALLNLSGIAYFKGDLEEARRLNNEALEKARRSGEVRCAALATMNLAVISMDSGDLAAAEKLFGEALEAFKALEDRLNIANVFNNLGNLLLTRGDKAKAAALYGEALKIFEQLGSSFAQSTRDNLRLARG